MLAAATKMTNATNLLKVTINGEAREIPEGLNVSALLEHVGLGNKRVAIERNRDILPRADWQNTNVAAGDSFEIVHFVGGG
jgi:thiamine biosynthesis protein ThiS